MLPHNKLSDATRILVNALFGKYGLVCVDADERALKQQFAEIIIPRHYRTAQFSAHLRNQ
jgi:hypothetical protein